MYLKSAFIKHSLWNREIGHQVANNLLGNMAVVKVILSGYHGNPLTPALIIFQVIIVIKACWGGHRNGRHASRRGGAGGWRGRCCFGRLLRLRLWLGGSGGWPTGVKFHLQIDENISIFHRLNFYHKKLILLGVSWGVFFLQFWSSCATSSAEKKHKYFVLFLTPVWNLKKIPYRLYYNVPKMEINYIHFTVHVKVDWLFLSSA